MINLDDDLQYLRSPCSKVLSCSWRTDPKSSGPVHIICQPIGRIRGELDHFFTRTTKKRVKKGEKEPIFKSKSTSIRQLYLMSVMVVKWSLRDVAIFKY